MVKKLFVPIVMGVWLMNATAVQEAQVVQVEPPKTTVHQVQVSQRSMPQQQLEQPQKISEPQQPQKISKPEKISLGEFKITHYCACMKCCGKTDGITATGTKATANRTIAVDPKVIPLGSKVIIDDQEYIAEDVGGAIKTNRIDIFVNDHQEALNLGVKHSEVFIVR